ncbi:MAG: hypothetical protein VXY89_14070 [SAR324 cluster bacterium]|nr:hypothetical protein [SAR324 cluster bacterium]
MTPPADIPTGSWLLGGHLTAFGDDDVSDPPPQSVLVVALKHSQAHG